MKNVLLLGGKRRSGKDHTGALLISRFGFHRVSYGAALKNIIYDILCVSFESGEVAKNLNESVTLDYNTFLQKLYKHIEIVNDSDYVLIRHYLEMHEVYLKAVVNNTIFDDAKAELINSQTLIGTHIRINVRMALQHIASMFKVIFDPEIWTRICLHSILNCEFDNIVATDFRFPYEDFRHLESAKDLNTITIGVIGKNRYEYDPVLDSHESETSLNDYKFDYALNNTVYSDEDVALISQLKAILKERGIEWRI